MKSRFMILPLLFVVILFSAGELRANGGKSITFQYIRDSDGGFPSMSGTYQYEFWTYFDLGGMVGESASSTTIVSESVDPMAGVSVTFDISIDPVNWIPDPMVPTETVKLKVTNPGNGEFNTFTGYPLTQDWNSQTFTGDYALPIELISFTIRTQNHTVILEWETASEVDNAGFNLYKSPDYSGEFAPVNHDLIPGAGNTSEGHEYSFTDLNVQSGQTYYYKLETVGVDGKTSAFGPVAIAVGNSELDLPDDYTLSQNTPNPFNPVTMIRYTLPEVSYVKLRIYDIRGRLVNELVNTKQEAGIYMVPWSGVRNKGEAYPSGIYFYELRTESYREIRKMFLVK